jgi:DNA polymerase-3 subunit delta'
VPLSAIIGHARLIDLLKHAVERSRVPQSLLFSGPEGVGKHATAVALAQAINCPKRRGGDACGTCPTCLRIAKGQHSDVTEIDRGEFASIKIEVLRERLLEVIGYRPFEAARRVYIIDPADDITEQAQNALLKTLEEPPSAAIIILISAYADTMLPTVRSRCRRLRFAALSDQDVARVLVERAGVDKAKARALAAVAGGSVSRALAEQAGDLEDDRDAALALLHAARSRQVMPRLKAAAALAKHDSDRRDREALSARLAVVQAMLRDIGLVHAHAAASIGYADDEGAMRELAGSFDLGRTTAGFAAIERAQEALARNASPKIVADWVAVTL